MANNESNKAAYVPDATLRESFSDRVTSVGFDGANIRFELAVTRVVQDAGARESTMHPVTRVVMPLNAINELMQKLGGALGELEKQGVLKKGPPPGGAVPSTGTRN